MTGLGCGTGRVPGRQSNSRVSRLFGPVFVMPEAKGAAEYEIQKKQGIE